MKAHWNHAAKQHLRSIAAASAPLLVAMAASAAISVLVVLAIFAFESVARNDDPEAMKYDAEYQSWCEGKNGVVVYNRYRRPMSCYAFTMKKG